MKNTTSTLALVAALSPLAMGQVAHAQTAVPAPAAEASKSVRVDEIVVTANRREENVQRTALSIQALPAEALTRAGISQPENLTKIATGVNIGTGAALPQIYIRGVGNYGTNNFTEGAVALNIDGVYIARPWAVRGAFFDLNRVEVLRGPQGTLYGRNASGGAINLISNRPHLGEFSGYVEGEGGNYGQIKATAAINLPVGEQAALRIAGQGSKHDGYLKDGTDAEDMRSVRAQLLFEPSHDFSILLSGNYQDVGGSIGVALVPYPVDANHAADPWTGYGDDMKALIGTTRQGPAESVGGSRFVDINSWGVQAEINWNLGPATLTVIPAYRFADKINRNYVATFDQLEAERNKQTSVEARLSNSTDLLKWVLGAYYFKEDQSNVPGHYLLLSASRSSGTVNADFDGNTDSYALFGQATLSLTKAFRATAGVRYSHESKSISGTSYAYSAAPCNAAQTPVTPLPEVPGASCRRTVPLSGDLSDGKVTWKVGLEYDIAADSMAYANVATGFKSGGFFAVSAPNNMFKPETLTSYEAGVKNRFLDNRLQLNAEVFYWDYRDHQENHLGATSIPGFFTFITENAGKITSYGANIDAILRPSDSDRISLGVQYNHAKYDSFKYRQPFPSAVCSLTPVTAVDCSGQQVIRAPNWMANFSYDHTFALGDRGTLVAGISAQYSSGFFTNISFSPAAYQDAFTVWDADLTYRPPNGRWQLSLWGRNLTDEAIYTSPFTAPSNPNFTTSYIRPPRTYGARLRIDF